MSSDGILIIDKPEGMTSHDVVNRVRRIFRTKRVGHTGTLDPFATGVLVLLIGNATRLAQFLDKDAKEYVAEIQFGVRTDTGDRTGAAIDEPAISKAEVAERLAQVDWDSVLEKFRGEIMQVPPMYSAKKIAGKKLYELARQGTEVERQPVRVKIFELAIVDQSELATLGRLRIRVVCSAGTYIRTLAEDIGIHIGLGAHLNELRRTAAGKFDLGRGYTLTEVKESAVPENKLLPMDFAVSHLAEFTLPDDRVEKTKNGLSTRVHEDRLTGGDFVRMTDGDGGLIAIGVYDSDEKSVRPKLVLI